jgi:hypothetical protein
VKHDARVSVSTDTQCECQERGQELTHLEPERAVFGRMLHGNPSAKNIFVVTHRYILYGK